MGCCFGCCRDDDEDTSQRRTGIDPTGGRIAREALMSVSWQKTHLVQHSEKAQQWVQKVKMVCRAGYTAPVHRGFNEPLWQAIPSPFP